MNVSDNILEVSNLKVYFGKNSKPVRAVDGVSLNIPEKSTVALVGESGCGKSATALSLTRLIPSPPANYLSGKVILRNCSMNIMDMEERQLRNIRGKEIAYIFQEPSVALNPVMRVGNQIGEAIKLGKKYKDNIDERIRLAAMVGLPRPEELLKRYPHELSGGMQQRVMIAMALACRPALLVADEPTTALDVTIQAQILDLLVSLQAELQMAILLITHNFGLVAEIADLLYVMYAGRIIETGFAEDVITKPLHHYTRKLLDAVPRLTVAGGSMHGIEGAVPDLSDLPRGCKFAPRCEYVQKRCMEIEPELENYNNTERQVRCFYPRNGE